MLKVTSGLGSLVAAKIAREGRKGLFFLVREYLVNEVEFINSLAAIHFN